MVAENAAQVGCNAKSNTTRIETAEMRLSFSQPPNVATLNPIQQGLKQSDLAVATQQFDDVATLNPIQQGLKHIVVFTNKAK